MSTGESEYLYDDLSATTALADMDCVDDATENNMLKLFAASESGFIDLNKVMIGAADANISAATSKQHLSKIWRIDVDTVE
mmetsp:Transcript_40712/g.95562  ORF Transcript_40712/g.95562 Transcript_40712/m.95562 type:complete len:81 (-) Transcript_40712:3663-3905(-)